VLGQAVAEPAELYAAQQQASLDAVAAHLGTVVSVA